MKTVYIQHLLKVLVEEYEDIEYMLSTVAKDKPTRREIENIRRLLSRLSQHNERLLNRFN